MTVFKKLLSALLICITVLSSLFCVSAAAEKNFNIYVSSATALPGDSVVVNVDIENNPGIMAVTVTVHFDPDVFQYEAYYGGFLKIDTLALHNGYLSVVYCRKSDLSGDGTLFGVKLKVKEGAQVGSYPVTVKNSRCEDTLSGAFANWNAEKLNGTVYPGKVTVGYTGDNCKHKFGEYIQNVPSGCTTPGIRSRSCTVCGHSVSEETAALGHSYSRDWTVDTAATDTQSGVMSRHCGRCDSVKDKVRFTVADAQANGFSNTVGAIIPAGSWEPLVPEERVNDGVADIPENTVSPQPRVDENISMDSPDNPEITEPSADELAQTVKKTQKTGVARWFSYIFGDSENIGVLKIIFNSAPDRISKVLATALTVIFTALLTAI